VTFGTAAASNVVVRERHPDHGDDAGECGGSGDRDGNGKRAERKLEQRIHLQPAVVIGFAQVAAATPQTATATVSVAVSGSTDRGRPERGGSRVE